MWKILLSLCSKLTQRHAKENPIPRLKSSRDIAELPSEPYLQSSLDKVELPSEACRKSSRDNVELPSDPCLKSSRDIAELPPEIIFNILSRVPVKYLVRSRCLSKQFYQYIDDSYLHMIHNKRAAEEPTQIIMISQNHAHPNQVCIQSLHKKISKEGSIVLSLKKDSLLKLKCEKLSRTYASDMVRGSCNGWLYLSQEYYSQYIGLILVHPLKREYYEVPRVGHSYHEQFTCGVGFDASTITFKMVCVFHKKTRDLCTMVHVLGTGSWRNIPEVPSYPIEGQAVFAQGCLYWLTEKPDLLMADVRRKIAWFDMSNEKFGLIDSPMRTDDDLIREQLVDLQSEVGYVYHYTFRSIEVWVLNQQEWVMHCQIEQKPPLPLSSIRVVGRLNKDGDILITVGHTITDAKQFFVYKVQSGVLDEANIVGMRDGYSRTVCMYPTSLNSIRNIYPSIKI